MTYLALDIDGTLFDSGDIIEDAFKDGMLKFDRYYSKSRRVPGKDDIISVIGQPTGIIFRTLFPDLSEEEKQKLNDFCTESLVDLIHNGGGNLIKGVFPTLRRLHGEGYKLLAASNGRIEYISAILKSNGIGDFFSDPIITIGRDIRDKSEIIKYYKTNIVNNSLFIMIGDRFSDKNSADINNIPFIGCDFGYGAGEELRGSKWIVNEFNSIYSIIKSIEESTVK